MVHEVLDDGLYELSGVGYFTEIDDWTGDYIETIVLILNGVNYGISEDKNDGYRSYGRFNVLTSLPTNIQMTEFPPQRVKVYSTHLKEFDEDSYYGTEKSYITIYNSKDDSLIAEVGTDYSDSYYPCAIFRWYPQNLPINKG